VAGRIIYLEVDDEITSAAARIRDAEADRLALVLPYGSRVATSRINFRLLSRDAMTHDKRLSIVAGDAATRALAASAGLPAFSSVAEYESAEPAGSEPATDGSVAGVPASGAAAVAAAAPPPASTAAPSRAAAEPMAEPKAEPEPEPDRDAASDGSDGTLGLIVPAAMTTPATASTEASSVTARTIPVRSMPSAAAAALPGTAARPGGSAGSGAIARPSILGRGGTRTPWLIGAGILALAVLLAGIGVYLLLPSATIVVTPQPEPVGPIEMTVTADTTATEPDAANKVVPAQQITIPVSANGTFPATGTRVELTNATGSVRFENRDPTSTNRIPAGSIVRTTAGIRFRTDDALTVPRAELVGLTIFPARATVDITAVDGGPEGNVDAGEIVIVPNGESSLFLKVTNPDPTTGGKRQEFKRVTQQDVDGAVNTLNQSLELKFTDALQDPSIVTGGATVIPSTGQLGETTPTVPPESLVGQEVPTFDLGLSASGTVIAVDTAPVHAIAEQQLQSEVDADHRLVAGSTDIEVGDAVVNGRSVSFPVTVSAQQIAVLDPDELTKMVVGKPIDEAKALLAPYGDVELTVSPDWSGSVPGFESRVHLTVATPVEIETPAPSGSPGP
jgi:hypothetical protein